MATTAEQVQQLYIGLLGRAADKEGLDYWVGEIEDGTLTLEQLRANIVNEQPEYINGLGTFTRTQLVQALYQNLFERDAGEEGLSYWVDGEGAGVNTDQLVLALIDGAQTNDRLVLDNKTDAAEFYTSTQGLPATYTNSGATAAVEDVDGTQASVDASKAASAAGGNVTFELTENRDNLTGTSDGDTFFALVGQNQDGGISNAFSTGDRIDGAGGTDMLIASMFPDNVVGDDGAAPVRPNTESVEQIFIEALDDSANYYGGGIVNLDATRMEGVEQFWSNFSGEDLEIDNINLRGDNLDITKDVTFGMRDTEFGVSLSAEFDSQSLLAAPEEASNSRLLIEIADVSTETPAAPLTNVSLDLGFDLDGEEFVLEDVVSTDGTYAGLVAAITAELAAQDLAGLEVALAEPYTSVTVAGNTVVLPFTAQQITITDPAGRDFDSVDFTQSAIAPVAGGFLVAGTAEVVDPAVTSNLIESNLILDNAGRGSLGGDALIGGQSNSPIGVERLNITTDRDSQMEFVGQTGNNAGQLDQLFFDSMGANGDLFVGGVDGSLSLINANGFEGDNFSLGALDDVFNLTSFVSTGSDSDVSLDLEYDGDSRPSSAQAFTVDTGDGDDDIQAFIEGTSTSGSTTASLTVTSTGGDNSVRLTSDAAEVNRATVNLGSGDDFVSGEETHLTAVTGGGDDTIFTENTGNKAAAALAAGASNFTADVGGGTATAVNGSQTLFGRTVQVTVAMPEESPVVSAESFVDGLEVSFEIDASNGFLTTERDFYEAVRDAINGDDVASQLVVASVDSNGDLRVQYLVDGATAPGDELVQIEVLGDWSDLSSVEQDGIVSDLQEFYSDSAIDEADVEALYDNALGLEDFALEVVSGTDSATAGVNTVEAGIGNDLIVLSSNDGTIDTVDFGQGGFGSDTIVHYDDVDGGDVLDFSGWLDNVVSASGSVSSQVRIAGSFIDLTGGGGAISDNSLVVTELEDIQAETAGTVTFAGLTNAQMLEALNTGFTQSAATADLVGNLQKSIVLVENNDGVATDNLGEYKVYEVAYNIADDEFTAATLVGTVDFTDSLDVVNMADSNIA